MSTLTQPPHAPLITAKLGFMRPETVEPDTKLPGNVLRAPTVNRQDIDELVIDKPSILHDCAATGVGQPQLETSSFERIDISDLKELQDVLETVRQAGSLTDQHVRQIKRHLLGKSFPLANGKRLRILFIAGEGLIIRKSGPNGLSVTDHETPDAHNGHIAAKAIHADQDVYGTPVRQMLLRMAPWVFRHESPNGHNRRSPVFLLNLWIPLQQTTRPLALMDQRSLNRREHQVRYALPVDYFLDRDGNQKLNDIWGFLHDPAQQWYFHSGMDSHSAWVFNTLSCPHGSFIAPGEDLAEQRYLQLAAARRAIEQGSTSALYSHTMIEAVDYPDGTSPALARAIAEMNALLKEAHDNSEALVTQGGKAWSDHAAQAMDRVVRKSIEMRLVAWIS